MSLDEKVTFGKFKSEGKTWRQLIHSGGQHLEWVRWVSDQPATNPKFAKFNEKRNDALKAEIMAHEKFGGSVVNGHSDFNEQPKEEKGSGIGTKMVELLQSMLTKLDKIEENTAKWEE